MKCDTSEPDSPNVGKELFNSFTTSLKILCGPFPILFAESYFPFQSLCACLILSRIFSLASLALMSGCTWFPSQKSFRAFVLIDLSSDSSSVDDSSIVAEIDSSPATFRSFYNKSRSSNRAKVMISPVCSCDNLAYGIY